MDKVLDFNGMAVIVTGGGKGVGRGITECFLEAGADVLICGRTEPESLPECNGRKALFTACDVRDYEQIETCVAFALEQFGRVDVLVNNAGGLTLCRGCNSVAALFRIHYSAQSDRAVEL